MQTLPNHFTHDQFKFQHIARAGDVVLLEKSKHGVAPTYEVVIVQQRPAEIIRGQSYPEREVMPRSEDWGVLGWSLCDLNSAQAKFHAVVHSHHARTTVS